MIRKAFDMGPNPVGGTNRVFILFLRLIYMLKGVDYQKLDELFRLSFLKPAREIIVENLESLERYDARQYHLLNPKGEYIDFCRQYGIISDAYLVSKIKQGIERAVENDFKMVRKRIKDKKSDPLETRIKRDLATRAFYWPDHLVRTEVFAYGLENGLLTEKQIKQIAFDHGEDVKSYCESERVNDLVSVLKKEVLTPSEREGKNTEPEVAMWAIVDLELRGEISPASATKTNLEKLHDSKNIWDEPFRTTSLSGTDHKGRHLLTSEERRAFLDESEKIHLP